ncbi:MAG: hypothetical protein M1829_000854 [Trizodia sp. TS-e1964]|nr:MAG: hypothetical protein M1829_000854 [Trizodia sp. TS-e1964]
MASNKIEDLSEAPPTSINPYEVLGLEISASLDEIKSAYRRNALRHHPDKAAPDLKDTAHTKFQEIAFAYAILSDERRRKRYDTTGNTEESLDIGDDDFNWSDFFREQWAEAVSAARLKEFSDSYKNSDEEKFDLLACYEKGKGDMNLIFEEVLLSNPIEDEDRFRKIIDNAVANAEVEAYPKYTKETKSSRRGRAQKARREEKEARELARELGLEDKIFGEDEGGKGKKRKGNDIDEGALAALIQQRQRARGESFLDRLEEKYAPKSANKKKKISSTAYGTAEEEHDFPPEEAFQRNANRGNKGKR